MSRRDRVDAGRRTGLARGGVPVASDAPLEVTVLRQLPAPFRPARAIGGGGGRIVPDEAVRFASHLPPTSRHMRGRR